MLEREPKYWEAAITQDDHREAPAASGKRECVCVSRQLAFEFFVAEQI